MKTLLITSILLCTSLYSKGQNCDTTFYYNSTTPKSISCIEGKKKKAKTIIKSFFNIEGENILKGEDLSYEFFDEEYQMNRVIVIKDGQSYEDYWHAGSDTLYNNFKHDPSFDKQSLEFFTFLQKNMRFPQKARDSNMGNRLVWVTAIVNKNGELTDIKVTTNHGLGLEEEALRVVTKFSVWGIITYKGKHISHFLRIPINFKLV